MACVQKRTTWKRSMMIFAFNDDHRIAKEGSGHITEAAVHVHDDVLYDPINVRGIYHSIMDLPSAYSMFKMIWMI